MEAVGDLDDRGEVVGQPERRARRRREEEREAARLVTPELVVAGEIVELFVDRGDVGSGSARLLELCRGFPGEVLELDPLGVAARGWIGRQVDRDARRLARGEQSLQLGAGGDVGREGHRGVLDPYPGT